MSSSRKELTTRQKSRLELVIFLALWIPAFIFIMYNLFSTTEYTKDFLDPLYNILYEDKYDGTFLVDSTKIDARLRELYTTGVPVPFDCQYACKVKKSDCTIVITRDIDSAISVFGAKLDMKAAGVYISNVNKIFIEDYVKNESAILHEVGHYFSIRNGLLTDEFNDIFEEEYESFRPLTLVPDYCNDLREYYAEAFSVYHKNPEKLIKACPKTYKYIDENIKNFCTN